MIILKRWEPTISPNFPSLIPFWIKVQGLPVHLWTKATIKVIGEDIGLYEKAEISAVSVRMRVHIDGLLPLIKSSVVEFPNGDEVHTTLVYERLDKHCTKCQKLDHELKECLVARAEARALKAAAEGNNSGHPACTTKDKNSTSSHDPDTLQARDQPHNPPFQFSASIRNNEKEKKLH